MRKNIKVCFVIGPTAVGKTDFAIDAALQTGSEIISCDSVQVYKEVSIGSAKPSLTEQKGVRHHLLDFVGYPNEYTAGEFRRDALKIIEDRSKAGVNHFLIVGGTGFYFQALEYGMYDVPKVNESVKARLQSELEQNGHDELFKRLLECDPEYAQTISKNDSYRLLRALEIYESHQIKTSTLNQSFQKQEFPYSLLKLGLSLDREKLRAKIAQRSKAMIDAGLEGEARSLYEKYGDSWAPLRSVGYIEFVRYFKNEITKDEVISLIAQNTARLAKRQMTWFRRDKEIGWFDVEKQLTTAKDCLLDFINKSNH